MMRINGNSENNIPAYLIQTVTKRDGCIEKKVGVYTDCNLTSKPNTEHYILATAYGSSVGDAVRKVSVLTKEYSSI